MKKYLILIIVLKIIKKIFCEEVGNNVLAVNNECSSLGINNPLKARDCQVYEFTKKYCCMVTLTFKYDNGTEIPKTACIMLNSIGNDAKSERNDAFKEQFENVDVLIECYSFYFQINFISVFFITFILL